MYYDRQGRSITLAEFAALHTEDYYRVALTEFGEVSVSTKVRAKAAAELAARCPAGCPHPKCPGGSLCCCQPDNGGDRS